jgi:hypothetical protein
VVAVLQVPAKRTKTIRRPHALGHLFQRWKSASDKLPKEDLDLWRDPHPANILEIGNIRSLRKCYVRRTSGEKPGGLKGPRDGAGLLSKR